MDATTKNSDKQHNRGNERRGENIREGVASKGDARNSESGGTEDVERVREEGRM